MSIYQLVLRQNSWLTDGAWLRGQSSGEVGEWGGEVGSGLPQPKLAIFVTPTPSASPPNVLTLSFDVAFSAREDTANTYEIRTGSTRGASDYQLLTGTVPAGDTSGVQSITDYPAMGTFWVCLYAGGVERSCRKYVAAVDLGIYLPTMYEDTVYETGLIFIP